MIVKAVYDSFNKFNSDTGYSIDLTNVVDTILQNQHFTTFTPPRKLMKLVYTRPELSPLDFLRFGP